MKGRKLSFSRLFAVVLVVLSDFELLQQRSSVADHRQEQSAAWPSGAPAARHLATVLVKTETWRPQLSLWLTRSPSLPLPSLLSPSVLPRLNADERPRPPWLLAELRGHRSSTQP